MGQRGVMRAVVGLVLAAWLGGCATTGAAQAQQAAAPEQQPKALLWSVEDPKAERPPLYLMGSVHLMRPDMAMPPALDSVIANTRVLAVEVDAEKADPSAMQAFVQQHGVRSPESPSVLDRLPEALRPRFLEVITEAGMPPEAAQVMRPWILSLIVSVSALKDGGFDESLGVETQLLGRMRETHRLVELESVEEQVAAMASAPDDAFQFDLERSLTMAEGGLEKQMQELVDAWSRGDVRALEALLFDGAEDPRSAPLYEAMFHRRNRAMAERLTKHWEGGEPMLVVVGAGHMVGPTGLPALLEAQGLRVTQLPRDLPVAGTAAAR